MSTSVAFAPGRVNLLGDHTDYNEGLALPMAIDRGVEVTFTDNDSPHILLYSTLDPRPARLSVDPPFDPRVISRLEPPWARLAAAVVAEAHPPRGGVGHVETTLPAGAGLSSSAAFSVALALALGVEAEPMVVATLCRRAESMAGSDVGMMDPLVSMAARSGQGLLIDFSNFDLAEVPIPPRAEVVVAHSGVERQLAHSPYAARRAECAAAALDLGRPLGHAGLDDLPGMLDPVLRRRVRHVVTECARVRGFAGALTAGDLAEAGALMLESHRSLAGDFEASTPQVDALVESLCAVDGVYGARVTGGGFGGCVVALSDPERVGLDSGRRWRVRPSAGARVEFRR